jgi:hypothetical protein
VAWDAYRREDGCWRVTASWPSGRATAHALWDLDKSRSVVTPVDEMAQFLSAERHTELLGQDEPLPPVPPRIAAANKHHEDDADADHREGPAIPSVSVLRMREERAARPAPPPPPVAVPATPPPPAAEEQPQHRPTARERRAELPSWDDILFGARHKPH